MRIYSYTESERRIQHREKYQNAHKQYLEDEKQYYDLLSQYHKDKRRLTDRRFEEIEKDTIEVIKQHGLDKLFRYKLKLDNDSLVSLYLIWNATNHNINMSIDIGVYTHRTDSSKDSVNGKLMFRRDENADIAPKDNIDELYQMLNALKDIWSIDWFPLMTFSLGRLLQDESGGQI